MEQIKNKIITISGEPASGKSTVVKYLNENYSKNGFKVHIISTGEIFRRVATREYQKMYPNREIPSIADIQADKAFAEKRGEIDGMIDGEIKALGIKINSEERPDDVYIIDSRLAWHNIPSSFAVRLTVNKKIAGKRVFNDETRGEEDQYSSLSEAIEKTEQRKLGEIERYKERYGVDLANPENYRLIVDTSYANPQELAKIIIDGEEHFRTQRYYPKTWTSPAQFLPVQDLRQTTFNKSKVFKDIVNSMKQIGYEPFLGEIDVDEYAGALYIKDGNHRTCAALSNGLTLLPYSATKVENGKPPVDIDSPLYMKTLYDWVEGLQYYGGKIGNITQYKNFGIRDLASIENVPIAREVLKLNKKEPTTPTENGR